ncbi:hypothetical protein HPB50_025173 [Hyalomma asiaticum]|uniref:Uncharacterized protein n=1 Tax=Hyalomma asiaticum TaxID=266040 RepID=A0ACB7S9B0_HYAAI|nr:hypothetical protein HPB50_025173 [Hyalomma asiaticum]
MRCKRGRVPPASDSVQLGTEDEPVSDRGGVMASEDMESLEDGGFHAGSKGGVTHTREHTALTIGVGALVVMGFSRWLASPWDALDRASPLSFRAPNPVSRR